MSFVETNDAALLIRIAAGDRGALTTLYDRYAATLFALARRIVGHTDAAAELLTDVFLELWSRPPRYAPERGTVQSWLVLQTRGHALAALRDDPNDAEQVALQRSMGLSAHVDAALPDYLLGSTSARENAIIELHLHNCRLCMGALANFSEEMAQLAMALPPTAPPPTGREGLLQATSELHRFVSFTHYVATALDLPIHRAQEILASLDEPNVWPGPAHAKVRQFTPPDARHHGNARFARVLPGTRFMPLAPGQDATVLILQGGCRDQARSIHKANDITRWRADALTDLVAMPGSELIYFAVP